MANVKAAIDFVLRQEDRGLTGKITQIPNDRGGLTRYGLTKKWHPELVASGFFSTMLRDPALVLAEQTYAREYALPLWIDRIAPQGVATALLSFAVNDGCPQALKLLQASAGVTVDGCMGPATLAAVNAADPKALLDALVAQQCAFYSRIVAGDPTQDKFLNGWLRRADSLLEVA